MDNDARRMDTAKLTEWLTAAEVAALLRVHPKTVKRWLLAGDLQGSILGNRSGWRISRTEVDRFMADRRYVPGSDLPDDNDE
jgi:excisionase family DNA binding protein